MRRAWFDPAASPASIKQITEGQDAETRAAHAAATGLEWIPIGAGVNVGLLTHHVVLEGGLNWVIEELPATAPAQITRMALWTYLEVVFDRSEQDALAVIQAEQAAGRLTREAAIAARRKVTDATIYLRDDPLLLQIAQALGVASNQAEIDAHFVEAAK